MELDVEPDVETGAAPAQAQKAPGESVAPPTRAEIQFDDKGGMLIPEDFLVDADGRVIRKIK